MSASRRAMTALLAVVATFAAACSEGRSPAPSASGSVNASSATTTPPAAADPAFAPGSHLVEFDVDGVSRRAVVAIPADTMRAAPVVFAFHGHGGNGRNFQRRMQIEQLWPEAIVVYPDGLVGHRGLTDPEGVKPGWQTDLGEAGDRDIAFFDAMLRELRANLRVDDDRVYLVGHSNGSAFVSLLLNQRGDGIAATATLSAQPPARLLATDPERSMFLSMGMTDPIVPFDVQQRSIPLVEAKLGTDSARATVDGYLRSEPGRGNLELETYVHPAGHEVPKEVPALVVAFFQRHTLSGG